MSYDLTPSLETTFAGLKFRSPIGIGAVGRPEGANLTPELHAEVEFWLGTGEDTEKYLFNTSTSIFVPKGLVHLPMIFKNVVRHFLIVTVGINIGKEWVRANAPRE